MYRIFFCNLWQNKEIHALISVRGKFLLQLVITVRRIDQRFSSSRLFRLSAAIAHYTPLELLF